MAEKEEEEAVAGTPDPVLIKLDPIWGYFCISDHNLILSTYGDMQL